MFVNALRKVIIFALSHRYHISHALICNHLLSRIEHSSARLTHRKRSLCKQYAIDVLGHYRYAPWLYVYTAISNEFKEGWIPDNYYGMVVAPFLKGDYGKLSSLKTLNSTIFHNLSFPDILCYSNGIFYGTNNSFVPICDVHNVLFKNSEKVVYKLNNSSQGRSIYFFSADSFCIDLIQRLGNGLFQSYIDQHEDLSIFAKRSVATIRITTFYDDFGVVSVRACYLRLGGAHDTHVQSKTHIRVPVDVNTGRLGDVGYTPDWNAINFHPTSGVCFAGKSIPSFRHCLDLVTDLHKEVPYARCIGWDVAIDNNGIVRLMEWNAAHNDIKFSEATQGPCFSDLGWENLPQTVPDFLLRS